MRKTRTGQKLWAAVSALCFIALFTTCKNGIGLGSTIDIKPPTIENNGIYPPNNAIIKGPFTLAVKADDDTSVTAVAVVITTADAYNSKINIGNSFLKAPSSDEDWWTLNIDPQGRYPISDGVYNMEIQATDTAGKVTTRTSSFTIDNAPPLLILNRPSTAALNPSGTYSDGDAFGVDFWLVGQVYDKSDVAKLRITAKAVGSGTEYTKELEHIPQNIRLKIDSFSAGGGNFYNNLYGGNTENGKKNFSYTVRVYDSARTYTAPGESSGAGEGNYTDVYYRSDDLYEKVLSKPKNKIQDVYAVLYNMPSAITDPTDIQTIKDEFNAVDKKIGDGDGQQVGTFALNPSLNPSFEIHGSDPSKEGVSGYPDPEFQDLYSGTILSVKLSRNLDGVPLKEMKPIGAPADPSDPDDDTYRFSHFFLAEWEQYKTYRADPSFDINTDSIYSNVSSKTLKPGLARITGTSIAREGGNYIIGVPIQQGGSLVYGKRYVLLVRGKDSGANGGTEFKAQRKTTDGDFYGIVLRKTGRAPTVSVTKINGKNTADAGQIYVKKDENIIVEATLNEAATIIYTLKKNAGGTVVRQHQETYASPSTIPPLDMNSIQHWIDSSSLSIQADGNYQLIVKAEKDGLSSPELVYHIVCDTAGPVVRIVYPGNNAKLNEDSKLLEISGTAFDAGAGLKAPAPLTVTLTKEGGSSQPVNLVENGENWKSQPIDLSGSNYGDGKYTLTVTTQDKLDLLSTETRTFMYDAAPPEITELKVDGNNVTNGSKVFNNTGTVTVSGKVVETYGVKEFSVKGETMPLVPGDFAQALSLAEDSHTITIKVKDKADKETIQTVTAVVDRTPPGFEHIKFADQAASGVSGAPPIVTSDNPIRITGTIKDAVAGITVSGIKEVNYAIADSIDATTVWKPLNGEFTGSDYTVNAFVQVPDSGVKKIHIKTIDNAGNESIFEHSVQIVPAAVAQLTFEIVSGNSPADTVKKNAGTVYAKGQFKVKIGGLLITAPASGLPITVEITKEGTPPQIDPADFFNSWTMPKVLPSDSPVENTVKPTVVAGEYTIKINAQGQERSQTVVVDKVDPAITVERPASTDKLNKTVVISGTASDDNILTEVEIKKNDGTALLSGSVSDSNGVDAGTAKFTGVRASNWSFKLNTADYVAGSGTLVLKAVATDIVGNKTEKPFTLNIDQNTDRPIVTVTNFTRIADANLVGSRILTGKVEDDDGPIREADIKIRISPATDATGTPIGPTGAFESVQASNGVWRYTIPTDKLDGKYHLDFELTDAAGTEFKTLGATALVRPYVMGYQDGESDRKDENVEFRLDTVQPEFKTDGVAFVSGASFTGIGTAIIPNAIVGNGGNQRASFRVFVKDASGIKKVELKLNNGTAVTGVHTSSADDAVDKFEAWDFNNVQLVEGAVPLAITATDNANFDKTWQQTIITDFTAPTITVQDSTLNTVYYKNADIIGQVAESGSDVSGVDAATIEYKIGTSNWLSEKHLASDSTELSKFERSAASWKVSIADVAKYKDGYGAVPPSGANNKIHTIGIQIKAKDKAGNEKISNVYQVKFDPAGSTPILELITPDANATLGTSVSVSGLARTARPEAAQPVQKIELQLSRTAVFTNPATSWVLDSKDYGQGVVILNDGAGYTYWQKTLEQAVITDILGGVDKKDVWLRVRGISADGSIGDWTVGRKCSISKDVAEFGQIFLAAPPPYPSAPPSLPTPYRPNGVWIKGDSYVIKGSVTHSTGIKTIEAKTENASASVQPLDISDTTGWFTARADGEGYDFAIPIKTSHYTEKAGSIEFNIIAEDNRTGGQSVKVSTQIRLKYDNSIPEVAIGTPIVKGSNTDFVSGVFTAPAALDPAKKDSYRVIADNKCYTVQAISGTTVTLSPNDLTGNFDYAIAEQPKILQGTSCQIEGIGEDSGSHIQKVKIELTVNGQSQSVMLNASDSSRPIESLRNNLSSFKGTLNTALVPNGEGTLQVVAYDGAGNTVARQVTAIRVKNNPLHISKLTLRTDLDNNGSYTASDSDETYAVSLSGAGNGLDANQDFRGSANVAAAFTYKNNSKSELQVELIGGYGTTRKVVLYKDDASVAGNKITELPASPVASFYTLNLAGLLDDIVDGIARKLILRVYDGSIGGHWYAETDITVKVAHADDQNPSGVIVPFFYNADKIKLESTDDFKLTSVKYDESTKQSLGHIEIAQITGLGDRPSVSGTVILRGIAYDNFRIKTLKLSGAGINGGAGCTITNTSGTWSTDNGFKVVRDSYSRTGHYVEWEYEWVTGMPALNQKVTLTVTDEAARTNGTATGEPATKTGTRDASDDRSLTLEAGQTAVKYQFVRLFDDAKERSYLVQVAGIEEDGGKIRWANVNVPMDMTQYVLYEAASNKKTLDVNIVPYITNVETALSSADSAGKGAFSRASTGEYPVRVGEKIKITGFNLTGASYKLGTQSLTEGTGTDAGTYEIDTTHSSGSLVATVVNGSDTIESINNKVNVAKLYNQEGNGVNNNTLTANRKLFVWKTEELINNAALESPQFVMDKQSKYYISYGNLKTLKDPLDPYNQKKVMRLSSKINGIEDNTWEYCYSKFHNTVIGYDDNGNPYIGATNTDRAGESTAFTLFFQQSAFTYAYLTGSNKRRLENSDNRIRGVYDVNRVQIPKMAVRGGGTGANPAKLAVVYFDNNVDNDAQVKFRYGTIRGADTIDGGISHDVISTGNRADPSNSGSAKGYEIVANSTSTFTGGQYAAVGLTSTNRAIVVWYDAANSQLVYSYRDIGAGYTAPAAGGNRQTTEWQNNAVVVDGGAPLYVDIALDDQDGLHIGYYSSGEGGVKYAYLPPEKVTASAKPATSDFKVVKVDTFMNPGTYLKIGVRKESGKQVPYISYYHTGFYGSKNAARIAWLKDGIASDGTVKDGVVSNKFTGDWVVMTVPATAGIKQYTICQGVPTGGAYADKVIAAYFTNKNYEMAVLTK